MKKGWIIAAVSGLCLGIVAVVLSQLPLPVCPVLFPPPVPPYPHFIAAVGLVEPPRHMIHIGVPFGGLVHAMHVIEGDSVPEGAPLFTLDHSSLSARLVEAEARYAVALATYQKQIDLPRPEDIPIQRASVAQAHAHYLDTEAALAIAERLNDPRAISQDEFNRRKYGAEAAKAGLAQAEASLTLLLAGAWIRDVDIAREEKKAAEAAVAVLRNDIHRSTIRAPYPGTVLYVNIHKGEFAATEAKDPLIIFGAMHPLLVRVDVNEEEIWRIIKGAPGRIYVRGNRNLSSPIHYRYTTLYLVPKQMLSGNATELVDMRVLQILYEIENADLPIYPGEIVDVYIEAKPNYEAG